jgi:hypothetical protein
MAGYWGERIDPVVHPVSSGVEPQVVNHNGTSDIDLPVDVIRVAASVPFARTIDEVRGRCSGR